MTSGPHDPDEQEPTAMPPTFRPLVEPLAGMSRAAVPRPGQHIGDFKLLAQLLSQTLAVLTRADVAFTGTVRPDRRTDKK